MTFHDWLSLTLAGMVLVLLVFLLLRVIGAPTGREFTLFSRKVDDIEQQLPKIQSDVIREIRDSETRVFQKLDEISRQTSSSIQDLAEKVHAEQVKVAGLTARVSTIKQG